MDGQAILARLRERVGAAVLDTHAYRGDHTAVVARTALVETLTFCRDDAALGFDLTMLRDVFSQTGANSRVLETDGEDMQNREHSYFFSAAHAAKDSGIALALGAKWVSICR